jgi:hypothetical protein
VRWGAAVRGVHVLSLKDAILSACVRFSTTGGAVATGTVGEADRELLIRPQSALPGLQCTASASAVYARSEALSGLDERPKYQRWSSPHVQPPYWPPS